MSDSPSDFVRFVGHLHPMLVHLPIGFLLLLGILELLAVWERFRHVAAANRTILGLAAPMAVVTATCGWLLAESGGYDPEILLWHRWSGVSVALGSCLLLFLQWRGQMQAYRVGLVGVVACIGLAGHFGGSLTHGRDFIFRYAPESVRRWLAPSSSGTRETRTPAAPARQGTDGPLFESVIQPLFADYCVACHGAEKMKADLRLDSFDGLIRGGESGPVLNAGASTQSLLIQRMRLGEEEDDHMPPAGKSQPSRDVIELLAWWIDAGAVPGKSAQELGAPEGVLNLLSKRSTGSSNEAGSR